MHNTRMSNYSFNRMSCLHGSIPRYDHIKQAALADLATTGRKKGPNVRHEKISTQAVGPST